MFYDTAIKAIETGIEIADIFVQKSYNLFATGEMGIGNTTTSSAMLKVFTDFIAARDDTDHNFIGAEFQLGQGGDGERAGGLGDDAFVLV